MFAICSAQEATACAAACDATSVGAFVCVASADIFFGSVCVGGGAGNVGGTTEKKRKKKKRGKKKKKKKQEKNTIKKKKD